MTIATTSLPCRHLTRGIGWSGKVGFGTPIRSLKPVEMPAEKAIVVTVVIKGNQV
jgi:hypothetical protein